MAARCLQFRSSASFNFKLRQDRHTRRLRYDSTGSADTKQKRHKQKVQNDERNFKSNINLQGPPPSTTTVLPRNYAGKANLMTAPFYKAGKQS